MLFWVREVVGWLFVVLSLVLLWMALSYIGNRQIVEGGIVAATSVAILRTGILLVRISTAARIATR